jgi:hypothetical protein
MNKVDPAELFKKYPHIGKKITSQWGTKQCRELMMELINDSRGGDRSGFSPEIAKIIFALLEKHDSMYPHFDSSVKFEVPFRAAQIRQKVTKPDSSSAVKYAVIIFLVIIALFSYMAYEFLYVEKGYEYFDHNTDQNSDQNK